MLSQIAPDFVSGHFIFKDLGEFHTLIYLFKTAIPKESF